MTLTNEEFKTIIFGAYRFAEEEDGYIIPCQYTEEQMAYLEKVSDFWYERTDRGNGKTIEIKTDATHISFEMKYLGGNKSETFELEVDGFLNETHLVEEYAKEDTICFTLDSGTKYVKIFLPCDTRISLRNFTVDGIYEVIPKKYNVLWMGDSITQGFGAFRSYHCYVNSANRYLDYHVINQGIGGYRYDKNVLMPMPDMHFDKIIVALGTNQFQEIEKTDVEEYYEKLVALYPETPILCVTPVWRGNPADKYGVFLQFVEKIKNTCRKYPNVTIVDGLKLIPHVGLYYMPDQVHPNALGSELYGQNLAKEIKRLGF
ncbi:MAG: SGNH/GDSL hydrolase family protein [Lachnospiraceae bacterium]|nr:SGNH/GDSL hydrolase family protein [Lachnospiraceae bacterium]